MGTTQKDALYQKILEMIPFDGCTEVAIKQATDALNIEYEYAKIYFPNGIESVATQHLNALIETTESHCQPPPFISQTIALFLSNYIDLLQENRSLNRNIIAFLCHPKQARYASRYFWKLAKTAWRLTPDRAVDFSYYTKRLTLIAVISSSLLYWLSDKSDNASTTHSFITRRLKNVAEFHSFKQKCKHYVHSPFTYST